jgi:hypothetical protein
MRYLLTLTRLANPLAKNYPGIYGSILNGDIRLIPCYSFNIVSQDNHHHNFQTYSMNNVFFTLNQKRFIIITSDYPEGCTDTWKGRI